MKKPTINFYADCIGLIVFLGLVCTGFITRYILPPGTGGRGRLAHDGQGGDHIKTFLSLGKHDWGDIHFYLAVTFVIFTLWHIYLHWTWIKNYCKTHFAKRA